MEMFCLHEKEEYVGTSAYIFDKNDFVQKYIFPDLMFRMQCHRNIMHPIFWLCMSQKNQRSGIRRLATGTAGTMPNISKKIAYHADYLSTHRTSRPVCNTY